MEREEMMRQFFSSLNVPHLGDSVTSSDVAFFHEEYALPRALGGLP